MGRTVDANWQVLGDGASGLFASRFFYRRVPLAWLLQLGLADWLNLGAAAAPPFM